MLYLADGFCLRSEQTTPTRVSFVLQRDESPRALRIDILIKDEINSKKNCTGVKIAFVGIVA